VNSGSHASFTPIATDGLRSPDQLLDSAAGAPPGPRFGHNFSNVLVDVDGNGEGPAYVARQAGTQRPGQQNAAVEEKGYLPARPGQSALIPKWVAALFSRGAAASPKKPTTVSTKPIADSVQQGSPEREAAVETPYKTGMSAEKLSSDLREGKPLEGDIRTSFESRYAQPLNHVRIHTDAKSASLCDKFGARAFAFHNHIAFGRDLYQPRTAEGSRLLRHEVAHVLQDGPGRGGIFRRAATCPSTCPPAGALPFVPVSDTTFNCYAYALNSPGSLFLQPGQKAGTQEFKDLSDPDPAKSAAAAASYFTPAGVLKNVKADLGSPLSTGCDACCSAPKRKVIAVTTDPAAVVGAANWDFHWYRKDADKAWSHKRGGLDAQRDDAAGTSPICNPCNASRSYPGLNYKNVVASWCV
jgi:hypothetical protein